MSEYCVRKARMEDVKLIHAMLYDYAGKGRLLPRSLNQIYGSLRDFYVAEGKDGEVLGCSALTIFWEDLAEIRSVAVAPEVKGKGLGRALVSACLDEARSLGLHRVFTLTYEVGFFEHMGLEKVGKETLPQKIWSDCLNCPKFPDCDETAMIISLNPL